MKRNPFFFTLLILAWAVLSPRMVSAQEDIAPEPAQLRKNSVSLTMGYDRSFKQDLNYAPINFRSGGFRSGWAYARTSKAGNEFHASYDFSAGKLRSDFSESFDAGRYMGNIIVGYRYKIGLQESKLSLHVGGQWHTYVDAVFFAGTSAVTFFALHGIDLTTRATYQLSERSRIGAEFDLALGGLLVRPPHTGWDKFIVENEN
ncbi:MAG: hypothetical protein AAF570_24885, partial [Bacteroidota bacterium]